MGTKISRQLTDEQKRVILRKAMILDKSDRRKSDVELKIEIDELKRMRNKDETELKLLKVEMMKLQQAFKKFKEMGGFKNPNTNIISLPDRYINSI